ncbi:MAG: IS30 family transposase [Rickettsiaceae bacterium]|nr:IS30 family transposase [Rickettsiaceae bacterium]
MNLLLVGNLARCRLDPLGYLLDRANDIAQKLQRRNLGLFEKQKNLAPCVVTLLKDGWWPEQISGRLKLENNALKVSHETIYKFIYGEKGEKQKLYSLLTRHKPKRTSWHSRKLRKSHIPESANIKHRPKIIEKRKSIGHFERDLVAFGSLRGSNVTTIVERKSRLTKLVHNQNKYTNEVIDDIINSLSSLPKKRIKTITFDRG